METHLDREVRLEVESIMSEYAKIQATSKELSERLVKIRKKCPHLKQEFIVKGSSQYFKCIICGKLKRDF